MKAQKILKSTLCSDVTERHSYSYRTCTSALTFEHDLEESESQEVTGTMMKQLSVMRKFMFTLSVANDDASNDETAVRCE